MSQVRRKLASQVFRVGRAPVALAQLGARRKPTGEASPTAGGNSKARNSEPALIGLGLVSLGLVVALVLSVIKLSNVEREGRRLEQERLAAAADREAACSAEADALAEASAARTAEADERRRGESAKADAQAARDEALREREQAERNAALAITAADRSSELSSFVIWFLATAAELTSENPAASPRDLLDRTAARIADNPPPLADVDAELHEALGVAYQRLGSPERAEALLREALRLRQSTDAQAQPALLATLERLDEVLAARGDIAERARLGRQAVAICRNALPPDSPTTAATLVRLGELLIDTGQPVEAEPLIRESLAIHEQIGPDDWQRFDVMSLLGASIAACGAARFAEAEPLLVEGYLGLSARPTAPPDRTRLALRRVITLYEAWAKPVQAADWRLRLTEPSVLEARVADVP